jgi:translation initiation factor eIF-2B subunit beta
MREICSKTRWYTARELITHIRTAGRKLIAAQPSESAVGNMVRRVLKIVREEHASCVAGFVDEVDVRTLLRGRDDSDDLGRQIPNLKGSVIETINELLEELELSASNISAQAPDHIHSNEVLMTTGYSKTVEAFLKAAAKKRKIEVIVAESAPFYQGQLMAKHLAEAGIETIVVTDSAVFAIMSRVNKVSMPLECVKSIYSVQCT